MPHPEKDTEQRASQGLEQSTEWNSCTSSDLYMNPSSDSTDESCFIRVEAKFKPMFAIKTWHRLHAVALLETDTVRLSLLILLAEEAILDRYIELIAEARESDEIIDLQSAIFALSQLREANQLNYEATNLVA
jgi:hypothetical protein